MMPRLPPRPATGVKTGTSDLHPAAIWSLNGRSWKRRTPASQSGGLKDSPDCPREKWAQAARTAWASATGNVRPGAGLSGVREDVAVLGLRYEENADDHRRDRDHDRVPES